MLNRLIDNGRCIYNYIYIYVQENLGPRKINRSDVSTINAAICWCTMIYNDTWSSWAFPLTAEPAKINQLMAYLCSETHGSGMFRYFADWATDTHTHRHTHTLTLWEYTQTHTQKNTKRGSTMINNDQHSPPRATLAPYISSYLLVLSMVVLFESVCLDPWRPTVRNNLYICWLCYLYLPLPSWVKLSQYPLGPWVSFCVNEPWPFGLPICKNDQKCRFSEMEIAENQR